MDHVTGGSGNATTGEEEARIVKVLRRRGADWFDCTSDRTAVGDCANHRRSIPHSRRVQ